MSKYKVGDKVVMEITDKISVMEEPWYVLSNATSIYEPYLNEAAESLSTYIEQARAEGQNEAWGLARKILEGVPNGGYSPKELAQIFGCEVSKPCIVGNTYHEAAAKVAEWEKAKEEIEDEEIKDGDVLEGIYDNEVKCIVTNLCPDNMAYLVFDDGTAGVYELDNLKKTGRHIDIDSFLKQIGG